MAVENDANQEQEIIPGAELVPMDEALDELAGALGLIKSEKSGRFLATAGTRESLETLLNQQLTKGDLSELLSFIDDMRALSPRSSADAIAAVTAMYQWEASVVDGGSWKDIGGWQPSETHNIHMPVPGGEVSEAQVAVLMMQVMPTRAATYAAQCLARGMRGSDGKYDGNVVKAWFESIESEAGQIRYHLRTEQRSAYDGS